MMFGSRLDNLAARKADLSISRPSMGNYLISDAELIRLAAGEEIINIGKTPVFYTRMDTADANGVKDLGPNNLTFSIAGSPTTSAEPSYSYVEPGNPTTPTNAISVNEAHAYRTFQDDSGATVPVSGSISGTAPTSIEAQLYAANGTTVLRAYAAINASIGSGSYTGSINVPAGGPYRISVRSKNGSTVLAESTISSAQFSVGDVYAIIGSSSASRLSTADSGTGFTPSANTSIMTGTSYTWSPFTSVGAATLMASLLASRSGKPIGLINYGESGTNLLNWINQSGTQWQRFLTALNAAGGKLKGIYITVGSNDAGNNSITSRASHLANMQTLVNNVRSVTGQPNLPVLWSGSNRRPPLNAVQANRLRMAENDIGDYPNVSHVQTLQFEVDSSDNVHLSSGPLGYPASVRIASYVLGERVYGGVYRRGPRIDSFQFSGNEVFVNVTQRSGTNFGTNSLATGFAISDASGSATITTTSPVNSGQYKLTANRALLAPVVVTYGAGSSPDMSSAVFDNGSTPLPMTVETEMTASELIVTPPADTLAPTFASGSSVAVTNITATGATITIPVAIDNVGVVGYQYSVDAGANYTNTSNRTATITNLPSDKLINGRARAFDAAGNYSSPLTFSFTTLTSEVPSNPVFMRSKQRTINIKAAPGMFAQEGGYWQFPTAKRPTGSIDPNATIDITFNWTEVLADIQDTISNVQFDIVGLTNKGSSTQGAFATIFVGNATTNPSITCRITTASNPPRIEDRTVYFTVEQQ
jgi:hypothetical protein